LNKEFIFIMSPYEEEEHLLQIATILEQITQKNSRKKLPGLWKMIDKLNITKRAPEAELRRRRAREKAWGGLLLVMGIFLFVPGIMKPQELPVPLVVGLVAVLLGLFYLRPDRKKKNSFEKSAKKLLEQLNDKMQNQKLRISFDEEELILTEEKSEATHVANHVVDYSFETEGMFSFVYENNIILFQKRELLLGKEEEFRKRLMEKTEIQKI